jgi:Uma2 family endonuclease
MTLLIDTPHKVSAEELIARLSRTKGKAEIVNGEIVEFMSTGDDPSSAASNIAACLRNFGKQTGTGRVYGATTGFLVDLPHRKSFSPDVSFFTGERAGMKFLTGAPVFAVEVRSESDYGPKAEREMAAKRADYFAAGTKVVWDVDLLSDMPIRSYSSNDPDTPRLFKRGGTADAEPALAGWTLAVDELFE